MLVYFYNQTKWNYLHLIKFNGSFLLKIVISISFHNKHFLFFYRFLMIFKCFSNLSFCWNKELLFAGNRHKRFVIDPQCNRTYTASLFFDQLSINDLHIVFICFVEPALGFICHRWMKIVRVTLFELEFNSWKNVKFTFKTYSMGKSI